ncbi:glycosyltransferase [Ideonella sp. DXS22W]|uniref:Glycosyltransferase n=1 Tax=Pseudaquabacterium inlustre TaxID=2984192 RepID=A0ABU9CIY1_9BURK
MTPLYYALYSGELYGTERMALATVRGLAQRGFAPLLLAPAGPVHAAARDAGVASQVVASPLAWPAALSALLAASRPAGPAVFVATRLEHSLAFALANAWWRRPVLHRMVVHGGGGKNVYHRNRWLRPLDLRFVANAPFVRDELVANGVPAARIDVAENFLADADVAALPRRAGFTTDGVRRVAVVSRLAAPKRLDLLFDALDAEPRLAALRFEVYGDGEERATLAQRAARHPNLRLHGFVPDAAARLPAHDLLLHTAPREPFGLVVVEAMACGVPVLVPDTGGPADIVAGGAGLTYRAGDARDLAARLLDLAGAPAARLTAQAAAGLAAQQRRFSEAVGLARYEALLRHPS